MGLSTNEVRKLLEKKRMEASARREARFTLREVADVMRWFEEALADVRIAQGREERMREALEALAGE